MESRAEYMTKKRATAKDLLKEAKRLPVPDPYVTSSELGEVLDTLRQKDMTWKEVNAWCRARGYSWSIGGMINGWRHWKKTHRAPRKK